MRKGENQNKNTSKLMAIALVLVLLLGCTVGGTLAWLTAQSNTVTNTFVVGDIGTLSLSENGEEITQPTATKSFTIVPGVNLAKDITVTYNYTEAADDFEDVSVYVFVKIATTAGSWTISDDGMSYAVSRNQVPLLSWAVDSSWTHLANGVYYQEVTAKIDAENTTFADDVIANDGAITVSQDISKANINDVATAAADLTFTAYAIQQAGFNSVAEAWAAVNAG